MSTRAIFGFAVALTAALASPAFAKTTPHTGSSAYNRQLGAYEHWLAEPHSVHPSWDVYDDRGRYHGTDPDPFIRSQLGRCREC
jgi:hypothetical protein